GGSGGGAGTGGLVQPRLRGHAERRGPGGGTALAAGQHGRRRQQRRPGGRQGPGVFRGVRPAAAAGQLPDLRGHGVAGGPPGGSAPSTSWAQHWSQAVTFNVGQPTGGWTVFASGKDPSDAGLAYRIYERPYSGALVLYKPLSYGNNRTGTTANATATTHALGG